METITRKEEVKALLQPCFEAYTAQGAKTFVAALDTHILQKKIKFPLLEYASRELYKAIPVKEQLKVTDAIISLHTIGGNVLAGIILQLRLPEFFLQSIEKAIECIIEGDQWYVCDIIGERVMGHALLTMPEKTLPELEKLARHADKWIVRSVGVGAHYAVKKGLKKPFADEMFRLLLSLSNTTDFHTKKGIGWAAKTIAKFHPDIIEKYKEEIARPEVKQWFKTKIKIGLGRTAKYAARHTS